MIVKRLRVTGSLILLPTQYEVKEKSSNNGPGLGLEVWISPTISSKGGVGWLLSLDWLSGRWDRRQRGRFRVG